MPEKGKMKAALLYGPQNLRVDEVDIPPLSDSEALVRVRSIGVCQSDIRSYLGIYRRQLFPWGEESYGLSGHEWSGEVAEVGESARGISPGDRVVPEIILSCGVCRPCARGMTNLCRNKKFINRGYAQYAKAPTQQLIKIPPSVSYEQAAFAEPIAVCLHTNDLVTPKPGEIVLIVGAGPMGLIHAQVTKLSGATVVVSEILEERLNMAKKLGADYTFNPSSENLRLRLNELTENNGADAVICATGAPGAIEDGVTAVGSGGKLVLFGGTYPPEKVLIDPNTIHYGEICIIGSYDHLPIHMHRAINLLNSRKIDVDSLISHMLDLDRIEEAFQLAMNSASLKVLVRP